MDPWKKLTYSAARRSRAELETVLGAFVRFCRDRRPELVHDLERLVRREDAELSAAMLQGTLPEGVPEALREAFREFLAETRSNRPSGEAESGCKHPPLRDGEWVIFLDSRGRTYLQKIDAGKNFTFHHGAVAFDDLIGRKEGCAVRSTQGARLLVFRPTLKDYLLHMPRHAQVVYPKDSAIMVLWGDLYPGARVLESGLGSGALAMVILRAIGPTGRLVSYEVRKSFIAKARRNIERFLGGPPPNHEIRPEDVARARLEPESFDRVFLDLPSPLDGLPTAAAALRPGGILVTLNPTVLQIQQTVEWLRASDLFGAIEVLENLQRPWHIRGHSVRPAHRMVAHTAFLVVARKILPGQRFIDDHYF